MGGSGGGGVGGRGCGPACGREPGDEAGARSDRAKACRQAGRQEGTTCTLVGSEQVANTVAKHGTQSVIICMRQQLASILALVPHATIAHVIYTVQHLYVVAPWTRVRVHVFYMAGLLLQRDASIRLAPKWPRQRAHHDRVPPPADVVWAHKVYGRAPSVACTGQPHFLAKGRKSQSLRLHICRRALNELVSALCWQASPLIVLALIPRTCLRPPRRAAPRGGPRPPGRPDGVRVCVCVGEGGRLVRQDDQVECCWGGQ